MVIQESRLSLSQLAFRFSSFKALSLAFCILASVGVRSGVTQTANSQPAKKILTPNIDLSLGVFGQLTPAREPTATTTSTFGVESTQTTQGTSPSAGVLATFHQSFSRWLGYDANFGYSRSSENYSRGLAYVPGPASTFPAFYNFSQESIGTNLYESTVAYIVKGPTAQKLSTFVQIGGGGLWFLPTQSPSSNYEQVRASMLFGTGINYKFTDHLGVRAEYRGLFYKSPDFSNDPGNAKLFTVTSEPTVSVVYTFGGGQKHGHSRVH
jgi:opacity protein-like surface antigen